MKASLLHREKHSDKAVELLKVRSNPLLFIDTRNVAVILMGDRPLCKSLKYQHEKTTPYMQRMLRTSGLNQAVCKWDLLISETGPSNDGNYEGVCYFEEHKEPFLQEVFSHL